MPLAKQRSVRRELYSSEAYGILRDAIVSGELAPGEQIKDTELASTMGLSRTPVREAVSRLVDAGLVETTPGVKTRVTTLSRRDVTATLDVLRVLDDLVVREAVPRLTEADVRRMRKANTRFETAVERTAVTDAVAADDAFHAVLIDAADNPVLARVIKQLHPQVHRILHRKFSTLLGGRNTVEHHGQLIERCAAGDATAAAELSAAHWQRLGGLVTALFDGDDLVDDDSPPG